MKLTELGLNRAYFYKGKIIWPITIEFIPDKYSRTKMKIYYYSHKDYERYIKFTFIPDISLRDKSYRTVGERQHVKFPTLKTIFITEKDKDQLERIL